MGYDVELRGKNNRLLKVKPFVAGSNIRVDETLTHAIPHVHASMSVTYNYAKLYHEAGLSDSLNCLHGMKAKDSITLIENAIKNLGSTTPYEGPHYTLAFKPGVKIPPEGFEDSWTANRENPENDPVMFKHGLDNGWIYDTGGYWKATPGNAGFILAIMLEWAKYKPEGTWRVS